MSDQQNEIDGLKILLAEIENDVGRIAYKGNSVAHWHNKAVVYRDALGEAWTALIEAGIHPDGKTDVATAIRKNFVKVE